jgi:hypothetical protein
MDGLGIADGKDRGKARMKMGEEKRVGFRSGEASNN